MDLPDFLHQLDVEDAFHLRRAVERLREGLFDPVAVRLLTAHGAQLTRAIDAGFRGVDAGRSPHLGIVGAYGQGKSHSLAYVQERALEANFATSLINLDPREIPFQDTAQVYRALMAALRFPDGDAPIVSRWRSWAEAQRKRRGDLPNGALDLTPEELPLLMRTVLAAIAQRSLTLEANTRPPKRPPLHPRVVSLLLARALAGTPVPAAPLKQAIQARGAPILGPLTMRGPEAWLQAMQGIGYLVRQIGYNGWVVLFDEGESIAQLSLRSRSRSYQHLHRLFKPEAPVAGLFPIFAFTDDFLEKVKDEDYDRVSLRRGEQVPVFERNYAHEWRDLNLYRLADLSAREWEELTGKLVHLHARAYRWHPAEARVNAAMRTRLAEFPSMETRSKLKALVDQLDLEQHAQAREQGLGLAM